jgi:hypothetical protein
MFHRHRTVVIILSIVLFTAAAAAQSPQAFSVREAKVHQGNAGQPLAAARNESRAASVARHLNIAEQSLVQSGEPTKANNGVTVVRFEQTVGDLAIHGVYAKASFNAQGALIYLIENLMTQPRVGNGGPGINESQALNAAMRLHYPDVSDRPGLLRRAGAVAIFQRSAFFHAEPKVTRVLVPQEDESLRPGMLVETWSEKQNLLHHTLVGAGGDILDVELRTNNDSYNVFVTDPSKVGQSIETGGVTPESPAGWLSPTDQTTTKISGNNVRAYLDTDNNNVPDDGGTLVEDGNFLAVFDPFAAPSTGDNPAVSVQNLFYLNNRVHDILYRHGFTESAGNFQLDNFGLEGASGDPVNAEAQDGGGTDNANFATPADGSSPRMQMYLWHPVGPDHLVDVPGNTYGANGAAFGPALTTTGITAQIVLVNDGRGVGSDGCQRIRTSFSGRIALVDRGGCDFTVKVFNAQSAGAMGVIVANNVDDTFFTMGGTDSRIQIPSVMVGQSTGAALRSGNPTGTLRKMDNPPQMVDASLDSDIVYHEYGHGLTWRMIGNMSGPIAGAIGEGAGDTLAMFINGDDAIAEYSASSAAGIRRDRYANYPRTYSAVTGGEVHNDGEIYGAIMWRMRENFIGAAVSTDTLFDYFVDGMNFTPSRPSFENMRDGMLQSAAGNTGHQCLIWGAFAQYGVGVGSKAVIKGMSLKITQSFAVPAQCQ